MISPLIKKLDTIYSQFIRLRDADNNGMVRCCTCGRIKHWKEVDCGHFIKRQHMATRFVESNTNGQCKHCNAFEQGANELYAEFIKKKYGENELNRLYYLKNQSKKFSKWELEELIKHYQAEVKKLLSLKTC